MEVKMEVTSPAAASVKTSPSLLVVPLFNFHFVGTTDDGSVPLVASPASEAGFMQAGALFTAWPSGCWAINSLDADSFPAQKGL